MAQVPVSDNPVQQGSIQFNNPVSEASLAGIAGPANLAIQNLLPVGSIVESMLTQTQFQAQVDDTTNSNWVLADGRSVVGSTYATLTGNTNIPDLRGIFRRAKNNGRSDGNQNPDGDLPLGTYTADKFASHTHNQGNVRTDLLASGSSGGNDSNQGNTVATSGAGGNETAPKNVTVNVFIRIN